MGFTGSRGEDKVTGCSEAYGRRNKAPRGPHAKASGLAGTLGSQSSDESLSYPNTQPRRERQLFLQARGTPGRPVPKAPVLTAEHA